jgi:hypothetical protein
MTLSKVCVGLVCRCTSAQESGTVPVLAVVVAAVAVAAVGGQTTSLGCQGVSRQYCFTNIALFCLPIHSTYRLYVRLLHLAASVCALSLLTYSAYDTVRTGTGGSYPLIDSVLLHGIR